MVELAKRPREQYVPLKDVAETQEISEKYLEAIVRELVAAGILDGQRGRGGGYRLRRPASECSAGEVLALVEGDMLPVACMRPGAAACSRTDQCETLPLWQDFHTVIKDYFNSISIADLADGRVGRQASIFRDGGGI